MRARLAACLLALACAGAGAAPFTLVDVTGATHALDAYHGRWVVLNVWASWCAPCVREMPELQAFAQAHPEVVLLGLSADGTDAARVAQFARRLGVRYPVIAGDAAALAPFALRAFPTTIVYAPDGHQAARHEGSVNRADVETMLARAALQ
jgi:thiol-disulfide isomerase/thioredoxin